MNPSNIKTVPKLEVHLFGRFKIFINGKTLEEKEIKGRKARSLLKLIAHKRNFQMVRDHVIDLLWPDLDADAANSQLYKALHHLRKALEVHAEDGADWIKISDNLIRVSPPGGLVTDVQQFEQMARSALKNHQITNLEKTLSVYKGDFLPMDRYAEWASLPREHYRQLYLDLLTTLALRYEEEGELSEAAERLRQALENEPTLETAHRGLMRIFAQKGQATRAFHQYEICREILIEELGVSPALETMKILDYIRDGKLAPTPVKQKNKMREALPESTTPFVGRQEESSHLDHKLDQLNSGNGGGLIISGEAGIGKTRLIQELIAQAQQKNLTVFVGRNESSNGIIAYGSFIGLIDEILHKHPEIERILPVELGKLIPGFTGDGYPAPHADKLAAKGYLFAQVHRFFSTLSEEEPVVIILEDMHDADQGSRELLSYLIQHCKDSPVLFVATIRKEENDAVPEFVSKLQKNLVEEIELTPFTYEEHVNLLHQHAKNAVIGADSAGYIYQLAEGNPFYAIELLQHYREEGFPDSLLYQDQNDVLATAPISKKIPASIQHMVQQKLENVSPSARHLLYIAAVIGRRVPYEVLAALWSAGKNNPDEGLFTALEETIRARYLEEHGLDYSFRHALVRETIYASISEARRKILHRQAAAQLLDFSSDTEEIPVEQIARHFIGAGEMEEGARYLVQSGKKAESAYAHDDAINHYQEALNLLNQVENNISAVLKSEILELIGDVYRACGRLEKSFTYYEQTLKSAEKIAPDHKNLLELHRKIAVSAILKTDIERSERHLEKAFKLADDDLRSEARLFITKALQLWHQNKLEEAYDVAQKALGNAKKIDAIPEISQACEILAMTCLPLGRWQEGLKYELERQIHGWSPEVVVATDAHLCLWEYHVTGDQPLQHAQTFMNQVSKQATEVGDMRCVAVCHYALGTMHLWRGNKRQAVKDLVSSLELHEQVGSPAGMAYSLARKSVLHTMMGTKELGWKDVQQGLEYARQAAVRDHCLQRLYGVGIWNRLVADDLKTAQKLVRESEDLLAETGACGACALELYPWLAYYYLKTSQIEQARECGEAVSELAQKTGNPIAEAIATIIDSSFSVFEKNQKHADYLIQKTKNILEETVPDTGYSPIAHYLERMTEQQKELQ